jgi:hypothetical protein
MAKVDVDKGVLSEYELKRLERIKENQQLVLHDDYI